MSGILAGKSILVTGGTGSFGQAFTAHALAHGARRVAIYSRDEYKQSELRKTLTDKRIRWFIGDVRDRDRLTLACHDVDILIHAAALKQVDAGEYNPTEFVRTNVGGAESVIWAALACNVLRVVSLSTDKACNPVNLYGATKLCAEKLFLAANAYVGGTPRFSVVRYGNVAGSRGSVVPLWRELLAERKPLTITDVRMTRFWMTLPEAVAFVVRTLELPAGYLRVPTLPSFKVTDLAVAMGGPEVRTVYTGIRPGEKLHESLVGPDEDVPGFRRGEGYTSLQAIELATNYLTVDKLRRRLKEL